MHNVGIISMGSMGRTIANSVMNSGNKVHWTPEGRSVETIEASRKVNGAVEHESVKELLSICNIIFCIGRGGAAEETIELAKNHQFQGIYVDGNNLHGPDSELNIASIAESSGINYVEALFRGYPLGYDQGGGEDKRDLYLSGQSELTEIVKSLFDDGVWKVHIVEESAKALNRNRFNRLF